MSEGERYPWLCYGIRSDSLISTIEEVLLSTILEIIRKFEVMYRK